LLSEKGECVRSPGSLWPGAVSAARPDISYYFGEFMDPFHECSPGPVYALEAEAEAIKNQLEGVEAALAVKRNSLAITGIYEPVAGEEAALADGKRRLAEIDKEQRALLVKACLSCCHGVDCPVKMY
jgi:hypothetical protein